jgi:hypothetical protein
LKQFSNVYFAPFHPAQFQVVENVQIVSKVNYSMMQVQTFLFKAFPAKASCDKSAEKNASSRI